MQNKFSNCFDQISSFIFHHEDTSAGHLTRISIKKNNRITKRSGRLKVTLDFKTSGKAHQMLHFAELSSGNKGPSFHNLTFLLMLLHYRL